MNLFTLNNNHGIELEIMPLGATIVSMRTPDRSGHVSDIVLGFDSVDEYLRHSPYFGCVVGRYGNRISNGRFQLNGEEFSLATNDGDHHLHGGTVGFDKKIWQVLNHDNTHIRLQLVSEDGDEGYPGELSCTVSYTLDDHNRLTVDYHATTNKPTVVNLTQHSYFNLAGHEAAAVANAALDHVLSIRADRYTEIDNALIPTGALPSVENTPLDFRQPTSIGKRINDSHEQLLNAGGYDHNFVLTSTAAAAEQKAAHIEHPPTGRTLSIYTSEPGLQLYSGNFLDGSFTGKRGMVYQRRSALAFETQHFPDSPNQTGFPSTELKPGEEYGSQTVFEFGVGT